MLQIIERINEPNAKSLSFLGAKPEPSLHPKQKIKMDIPKSQGTQTG